MLHCFILIGILELHAVSYIIPMDQVSCYAAEKMSEQEYIVWQSKTEKKRVGVGGGMKEVARQTADSCWVNRPGKSKDEVPQWWLQHLKEQMPVLQTGQTSINLHNRLCAHCAFEEIVR